LNRAANPDELTHDLADKAVVMTGVQRPGRVIKVHVVADESVPLGTVAVQYVQCSLRVDGATARYTRS